jgi:glycosyltransferase involved in cell wall biosynthesis
LAALAERIHAPTTLVVVGREQATERIGPVSIRHDPYRKGAAMAQCYQAADVYVHAAVEEVFGLVVAEAMSTGLPVVASDVGGVPELVRHGEHGLLAPPQDPAALARCIERLIAQPDLRERLGRSALQKATRDFSESLMLDRYFDWFEEVLALDAPLRPTALQLS